METSFTGPVGFCIEGMSGPGSGAWTRLRLIVQGLVSAGLDVHILGEIGLHDDVETWPVTSVKLLPKLSKLQRVLGRAQRISAFARATGSRVIHLEAPPFIGSKEVPTICTVHDLRHFDEGMAPKFGAQRLYSRIVMPHYSPNIRGWLGVSRYGVADIQKRLRIASDRIFLVPPIVSAPIIALPLAPLLAQKYVLALGHLEPRKNLETLVRATKEIAWPAELELWIAGENRGSLRSLQALAGPQDKKVRFLGPVSEGDKWRLLSEAAMVAVPSLVEGFGLVAVEAPLSGSIALVSDRTALPELAAHPLAQISAQKPALWAERISALASDPEKIQEILASQLMLSSDFRAGSVIPGLLEVYGKLA